MNRKFLTLILCMALSCSFFVGAAGCSENTNNKTNRETSHTESANSSNSEAETTDTSGTVDEDTDTTYDENGAFLLRVEEVFTISGRGTVITGTVQRGTVKVNDEVQIIGLDQEIITTTVTGIETFKEMSEQATVGDNIGMLLKDVKRDQIQRGQVIAKPNSITAVKKFEADLYVIPTGDGGREAPFVDGYRPRFHLVASVNGTITLPSEKENVKPGETASITMTLDASIAMEVGTEFTLWEGEKIVAIGKVTKIY